MAHKVNQNFDFQPRGWQAEAIKQQKRFTVLAVHRRAGKTTLSVNELILKALTTENSLYAYIAPELKQAKLIAWSTLKERCLQFKKVDDGTGHLTDLVEFRESELIVRFWNGSEIRLFGADNPDSLRGSKLAGAVIDEVAQMPKELWIEIVYPALMDSKGFALFIGTPKGANLFSDLFDKGLDPSFTEWVALKFTCYQTDALSPTDIEEYRRSVPEEVFRREMLCDFSASADNTLLSLEEITQATHRYMDEEFNSNTDLYLGVDVARFGSDRSVLIFRRGLVVEEPIVLQGTKLTELSAIVKKHVIERNPKQIFVDGTGVGGGVVDILDSWGIIVNDINFGHKSLDSQYLNRRTEMWCKMADFIKKGGILPKNVQLMSELAMPTYDINEKNQKVLESKKQIRDRLGKSPDLADALALTFADDFPQEDKSEYEKFLDKFVNNDEDKTPYDRFEEDIG